MATRKIVVTGPFNAGKTEFIKSVSEIEVVSTERKITTEDAHIKAETTVAMDFGRLTLGGNVLHLFGTPGQPRFEFMWEILAKEMDGFVVLVDSTDPDRFEQAQRLIRLFTEIGPAPFIVAATKQDLEGALRPSQIRQALRLPPEIPVLPNVAIDPDSVRSVLVQLDHLITWGM
ncbi:MAG: GTP-binding protein [Chloroflexi bacterium]|nr:MAG: GTP-binding protein [Chloroflexota bacterium]